MKLFDEMLIRMHKENYTAFMDKLLSKRVPIACFIIERTPDNLKFYTDLLKQGFNLVKVIMPPIDISQLSIVTDKCKYILVKDKLAASILRIHKLKDISIIIISKNVQKTRLIYDTYMTHLHDLAEVYCWLDDKTSRKTFIGFLLAKVTRNINYAIFDDTSQYICKGFLPLAGSVVIDGGACDGSTAAKFSDMGYNVYAFEMDKENFKLAEIVSREKNFVVENLGLGSYNHKISYTHDPFNIGITRENKFGNALSNIITLDYYIQKHKIPKVDFIKLDTEGAELEILKGAKNIISSKHPILSVSIYHKTEHIWEIIKYIKSLCPGYKFALRHYLVSKDDTPFVFNEALKKYLIYIPDSKLVSFGECILFAKQ